MKKIIVGVIMAAACVAFADGEEATFGAWRISVGGNMAFGTKVSANYNGRMFRNFSGKPTRTFNPANVAIGDQYDFDNGAYIFVDGSGPFGSTRNWRIPRSMTEWDGARMQRSLNFSNTELNGFGGGGSISSDDGWSAGASIELSRTLWQMEEYDFGVDLAIGFAWMMCNNILDGSSMGKYSRTTYSYEPPSGGLAWDPNFPTYKGDWYGAGPDLGVGQGDIGFDSGWTYPINSSGMYGTNVSGDYGEIELSAIFRPWYEITDWWRVFGSLGLGVGYGSFDFEMRTIMEGKRVYNVDTTENKWGMYGLVGGGTIFRLWDFDLSTELLYRFGQNDIEFDNNYVSCSLEKPSFVLRIAVGYEF